MPPQKNFSSRVHHVQSGSAVSAGNTGRSTRELEGRTNYLKEIVDAAEAGRLLVRYEQALDPDVLEGQAVFWDDENKRFARALAGIEDDPATGVMKPTAAADAIGMVLVKETTTSGTVGLLGMVNVTPEQLLNMTGSSTAVPGRYYLSATDPGQLVVQRPPVTVAVAYLLGPSDDCESNSWLFLLPQMRDFLEDHIHFQFELTALPAGGHVPPTIGEEHVITDADADLPGWLPAGHAAFNGMAPTGAKFGYNLSAHSALSKVWPPIPVTACLLELHKPDAIEQFQGAVRVTSEYIKFDKNGIWWMTNCYDQVPWPTDYDTTLSSSSLSAAAVSSSLSSESAGVECPLTTTMRLILSFIKMTFATDKNVVTSLQPEEGQPFEYVNCEGQPANTGELFSRLTIEALIDADEAYGGLVLKEIIDSKLLFGQGWVTEGLVAGSEEIVLSSTRQRPLDPTKVLSASNPAVHQGIVVLDLQLDPTERELNPQIVRLGDAQERAYRNLDYLGFPNGRDSSIRLRFNIPPGGLPSTPKLKIRAVLFGLAAGPFSEMTMSYRRITRPTDGTPTAIVDSFTALTFDVVTPSDDYDGLGTDLPAGNLIEVESDELDIEAGETIIVVLARAADASPAFAADIGVLRIGGITFQGS